MAANKTTAMKIEEQKARMEQMQNELNRLFRQQKEEDRKARTHRICERGGLMESLLPDTIMLSAERFKVFLEKTVANKYGCDILTALVTEQEKETREAVPAQKEKPAAAAPAPATPDTGESTMPKSAEPAQSGGVASAAKEREVMRPEA